MSASEIFHDVIVIGGGISGLYAARCLTKEGVDVVALEAQDHVGGRSLTQRNPEYGFADIGGAYVGAEHTKLLSLVEELGGSVYNLPSGGKSVLLKGKQRILFSDKRFPLKYIFSMLDVYLAMRKLDKMGREIPLREPWNAPKAEEWDNISVKQFFHRTCWTGFAADLLTNICEGIGLMSADEMSLLGILHDVAMAGGAHDSLSLEDGNQDMKITEGSSSVSEKMAAELKERIKLNTTVTSIDQTKDLVEIRTENGDIYRSRQVIMAASPLVLRHVDIKPPLSSGQQAYIDDENECNVIKAIVYYKKRYWGEKGLKGMFMTPGRICTGGIDDTKADGSHPAIVCFISDKKWTSLPKEERKQKVIESLVEVFYSPEMAEPVNYVEKYWSLSETGRYHGICVPAESLGFLTKCRTRWGESQDRLHFAGTEAAFAMRGYMEGGLRAAEVATAKVLQALGRTPSREYETEPVK